MASGPDFPKPKTITGGCLCGAIRYRVDFPEDNDFLKNSGTCQCTQCRRQSGSLFYIYFSVTGAAFKWLVPGEGKGDDGRQRQQPRCVPFGKPPSAFKTFSTKPGVKRSFCGICGGYLNWILETRDQIYSALGTVDPLYLFGDGADGIEKDAFGQVVPEGGYSTALASGNGSHEWCANEVKGVTDGLAVLGVGRGTSTRHRTDPRREADQRGI